MAGNSPTGFCMHPSPGSHRYCDEMVNDATRSINCTCDCHNDMAPFDEADAIIREKLQKYADAPPPGGYDDTSDAADSYSDVFPAESEPNTQKPTLATPELKTPRKRAPRAPRKTAATKKEGL